MKIELDHFDDLVPLQLAVAQPDDGEALRAVHELEPEELRAANERLVVGRRGGQLNLARLLHVLRHNGVAQREHREEVRQSGRLRGGGRSERAREATGERDKS